MTRSHRLLALLFPAACSSTAADGDASDASTDASESSTAATSGEASADDSSGDCVDAVNAIVFLEFDGVTLEQAGVDDATANQTSSASLVGVHAPPLGLDPHAVTAGIAAGLAPFAIDVTNVRPPSGRYSMIVFSSSGPGGGVISLGSVDCLDQQDATVGASFADNDQYATVTGLALIGQSFGLELTDGDDAMNISPIHEPVFLDACFDLYAPDMLACTHAGCPDGQQSSVQHLLEVVGPRVTCD